MSGTPSGCTLTSQSKQTAGSHSLARGCSPWGFGERDADGNRCDLVQGHRKTPIRRFGEAADAHMGIHRRACDTAAASG